MKETTPSPTPVGLPARWPIFNIPARVAWWEDTRETIRSSVGSFSGPWYAEYRGDAKTLNAVLADFAKLDVKRKQVIVHDGIGKSTWLNWRNRLNYLNHPNDERAKQAAAKVDWTFMVWQPAAWEQFRMRPPGFSPIPAGDVVKDPPARIEVLYRGAIRWTDVTVPQGVDLVNERLESHGFTLADGVVLEGKVIDLATKQPVPGGCYCNIASEQCQKASLLIITWPIITRSPARRFVGFSAATYNAWENHDLLSWTYTAVPEPSSLVLLGISSISLFVYTWRRMFSANDCAA